MLYQMQRSESGCILTSKKIRADLNLTYWEKAILYLFVEKNSFNKLATTIFPKKVKKLFRNIINKSNNKLDSDFDKKKESGSGLQIIKLIKLKLLK